MENALKHATEGEAKAAIKLVELILQEGMVISVHDGEWVLKRSANKEEILDALCNTDETDKLNVRDPKQDFKSMGTFFLIWGNAGDGSELIADHTDSEFCHRIWDAVDSSIVQEGI
jgi:hypothetical protein